MDVTRKSCPFLGMIDDPATFTSFPSLWNNCHNAKPVAVVELAHQNNFCLSENYHRCPVYVQVALSKGVKKPLPPKMRAPNSQPGIKRLINWKILPLFIMILALLVFAGFNFFGQKNTNAETVASGSGEGNVELTAAAIAIKAEATPTPLVRISETEAALAANVALTQTAFAMTQTAFAITQYTPTPTMTLTSTPTPTKRYIPPTSAPAKPKPKPKPTLPIVPTSGP